MVKKEQKHLYFWNYMKCCALGRGASGCQADIFSFFSFPLLQRVPDLKVSMVRNQKHLIQMVMEEQPDIIAVHLGCMTPPPLERMAYNELRHHYDQDKMLVALGPPEGERYFRDKQHVDYVSKIGPNPVNDFFERIIQYLEVSDQI